MLIETIVGFVLFYIILNSPLSVFWKVVFSLILFYVYGERVRYKYGFEGGYGVWLYKSREIVDVIKKISYLKVEWLLDVFLYVSFGILALPFLGKSVKEKAVKVAVGLVLLTLISYVYSFSFYFLVRYVDVSSSPSNILLVLLPYVFGIGGGAVFSVLLSAVDILEGFFSGLSQSARASLLLPGINLPFFEGALALIVLLIVHEFSHAIAAFRSNVRVSSAGVVFLGFIPIGGFVEPDESSLRRAEKKARLRIYVAGTASNYLFGLFFFLVFLLFLHSAAVYGKEGCLVVKGNEVMEEGTFIYNCDELRNASDKGKVVLKTNRGERVVELKEGKVGVYVVEYRGLFKYYEGFLGFVYNLLGLLFSLNVIVATVNLLPAFVFDGAKMVEEFFGSKIAFALNLIVFLSLIVLFLPSFS